MVEEGLWSFVLDEVLVNSCGVDPEEGDEEAVEITVTHRNTVLPVMRWYSNFNIRSFFILADSNEYAFALEEGFFSRTFNRYEDLQYEDDECRLAIEEHIEGHASDPEHLEFDVVQHFAMKGECQAWYEVPLPACEMEGSFSATYLFGLTK